MEIERRAALGLLAGGIAGSLLPASVRSEAAAPDAPLYLSARAGTAGDDRASGFSADGARVFDLPLPGRGHSFAVHPDGSVAVHFARRPGRFALVLDLGQGTVARTVAAPDGRHFYGHGVFSPDARLLYATENDFVGERGVIGVYDAARGYARVGELPSHGIGPHEIALLSDGETLVVANGGIATHPDLPRVKLNLPTMAPSLCFVDRRSGALRRELTLYIGSASAIWPWARTIRSRSPCSTRDRRRIAFRRSLCSAGEAACACCKDRAPCCAP